MIQGYVCVTERDEMIQITKSAYLENDADLANYGIKILEAALKGSKAIKKFVEELHKDNLANDSKGEDPCEGFKMNWIYPDKDSRAAIEWDYADYGYIYNANTERLCVYNKGSRLFSINTKKSGEINKYKYIFQHDTDIYAVMSYDKGKLCQNSKITYVHTMHLAADSTLSSLKRIVNEAGIERIYLDTYQITISDPNHHYKTMRSSDTNKPKLQFMSEHINNTWNYHLKTPFGYITLGRGCRSEKVTENYIRDYIAVKTPDKLFRLAEIFKMLEDGKLNSFSDIKDEWDKEPWFKEGLFLSPEWIQTELELKK